MRHEQIEAKAEAMLMPILEAENLTLVDMEYVKEAGTWYLRAYIDKEGGVTVDDCERVSRAFNPLLDADDFIEDAYIMEISSPGLGRPLKKDKDFTRNLDRDVEIRLFRAVDGEKELVGTLKSFDKDRIVILGRDDRSIELERKNLALIREYVDWDAD